MANPNHWIFVISDSEIEFNRRLDEKKWPIYLHTTNRKKIQAGNHVVFYKAGTGGQKIIGRARTSSAIIPIKSKMDFFVRLEDVEHCEPHVRFHTLVEKLDFIKNKADWGRHMQGGVRPISKKDYETMVSSFVRH